MLTPLRSVVNGLRRQGSLRKTQWSGPAGWLGEIEHCRNSAPGGIAAHLQLRLSLEGGPLPKKKTAHPCNIQTEPPHGHLKDKTTAPAAY